MAFFYSLAIECGPKDETARKCAKHFEGWDLPLEEILSTCKTNVSIKQENGSGHNWWVVVIPLGVSQGGVVSNEEARRMSAAGYALLERLKSAPSFRFALVGVEAFEALEYDALNPEFGRDPTIVRNYSGLVVTTQTYKQLNHSRFFEAFVRGKYWIPYQGEIYRGSNDTL